MAVLPPVLRPPELSFCAFCNCVGSVLDGSAAPVPVDDAALVGNAAAPVREKVAVTVTI
jgi:hypothetical protein